MGQPEGASILGGTSAFCRIVDPFRFKVQVKKQKKNAKIRGTVQFRADSGNNLTIVK